MSNQTKTQTNGNSEPQAPQIVARNFGEAPASVNLRFDYRGYKSIQFTLRGESGIELLQKLDIVLGKLEQMGATPNTSASEKQGGGQASGSPEDKSFLTSQLVPEILENSDEPYWKIKGIDGKFPKFAVRVWPEVLEEIGIKVTEIPVKKHSLEGYRAYYEANEAGNPKKVIRLEKVS
jgi:hypothetical protein